MERLEHQWFFLRNSITITKNDASVEWEWVMGVMSNTFHFQRMVWRELGYDRAIVVTEESLQDNIF